MATMNNDVQLTVKDKYLKVELANRVTKNTLDNARLLRDMDMVEQVAA